MNRVIVSAVIVVAAGPVAAATFTFKARNCARPDTRDMVVTAMAATLEPASCAPLKLVVEPTKAGAISIAKTAAEGCRIHKIAAMTAAGKTWAWNARKPTSGNADFYVDCLLGMIVRHFPAPPAKIDPKNPED